MKQRTFTLDINNSELVKYYVRCYVENCSNNKKLSFLIATKLIGEVADHIPQRAGVLAGSMINPNEKYRPTKHFVIVSCCRR